MNIHFPLSYLSGFLEEYPLYSKFGINQPAEASDLEGLQFNSFCKKENEHRFFTLELASKHNGVRTHSTEIEIVAEDEFADKTKIDFTEMYVATCQSCRAFKINMIISGGTQKEQPKYFLRKIGQYPASETNKAKIPGEVAGFLSNENKELYRKALKNLEMGFGAGAFVYFQKLAEKEFEKIIEKISNPYSSGSTKITEAFKEYLHDHRKSKFIEEATPYLPESLQKHGANTLLVIYDSAFIPVYDLTEEECIKKSKDIDMLLRYLFKRMNEKKKIPI